MGSSHELWTGKVILKDLPAGKYDADAVCKQALKLRIEFRDREFILDHARFAAAAPEPTKGLFSAYGRNKRIVKQCSLTLEGSPHSVHVAMYHDVSRASASVARAQVQQQLREVMFGMQFKSPFVAKVIGYVIRAEPVVSEDEQEALYQLDALVFEATPSVEFTLQQVIVRRDIDVPLELPFYVRQVLTALAEAETWYGGNLALRNVDGTRIVIFRLPDRTMCARYCDLSAVRVEEKALDRSAVSGETADAYAPEVKRQHGFVTSRTDGYCLGLVVAQALVVAASTVANAGPTTKDGKPVTFEELRAAGPAALLAAMEALPVRVDNGLYEMACRLLTVEPGLRPSAVACLTGLTPGQPVTYAGVGAQSAAVLEKPYEVADWIVATEPASEAPDILVEQSTLAPGSGARPVDLAPSEIVSSDSIHSAPS
jgi:hypothetical protein